jgi:hypothetical protein
MGTRALGTARAAAWSVAAWGTVAVAGCRDGDARPAQHDHALLRDLERASTAATTVTAPRTRFVSAIELAGGTVGDATPAPPLARRAPQPQRARTRTPVRLASHAPAPTPAPARRGAATEVAEAPAAPEPREEAPAAAPAPESRPADSEPVARGPSPDDGAGTGDAPGNGDEGRRGGGGGWGRAIGGVIGVVIRGGAVGDIDHCERDEQPRRRGRRGTDGWPGGVVGGTIAGIGFPTRGGGGVLPTPTMPRY